MIEKIFESCILKVPRVTVRDNTESQETVRVGSDIISGTYSVNIVNGVRGSLDKDRNWRNPFEDGRSAEKLSISYVAIQCLNTNLPPISCHEDNNLKSL